MNKLIFSIFIALILCCSIKGFSQELKTETVSGYLRINVTDLDSVYVVVNDNFNAVFNIASGDTLTLATGTTKVRIIKKYYQDLVTTVEIQEGEIRRLGTQLMPLSGREIEKQSLRSSYARLFWEANNFILSDPETDLFVNGEYVGTHFAKVDTVGTFDVTGIHSSGARFTKTFKANAESPFHFHQKHVKPSRATSWSMSILPGGSQFYKKQTLKGIAFTALTLGGAALAYSYESRYQESFEEFGMINFKYRSADNPYDAIQLGVEAEKAYNKSVRLSKTRNRILYGTALVYFINIVDGFMAPAIGFREQSRLINPYLDFDLVYQQPVIGVKTTF
jgi:hypothetical protein